ncbi:MAG: Hpt domain-containing protein [Gemmatimonadota bacterium]
MSVGLLDFFVLEASDFIDRLQRLLANDEPRGPDSATLLKLARGLRGSAVMARLSTFADAASGLERAAMLLHEGRIAWTPELGATVAESVTELRALVPMARLWGESQDQRARTTGGRLSEVIDAVERHGQLMQSGGAASAPASPASHEPNRAVSAFFNSLDHGAAAPAVPSAMSSPVPPTPVAMRSVESASVATPLRGVAPMSDAPMPIVPIASLAPASGTDAVVFRASSPAITFAQRFISDVAPLVASLRARLTPIRQGAMQEAGADMLAAFRPVLLSLRDTAASYEHDDVRAFCDAMLQARAPLAAAAAGALDSALTVILQQDLAPQIRAQRLTELRRVAMAATPLSTGAQSEHASRPNASFTPRDRTPIASATQSGRATPLATPTVARATPSAPSGRELNSLLSQSLENVQELVRTPLDLIAVSSTPTPTTTPARPASGTTAPDGEPDVVPIDDLLYRGPRALSRARHIVGQLRTTGDAHDAALIRELFDLVELAGSSS